MLQLLGVYRRGGSEGNKRCFFGGTGLFDYCPVPFLRTL